MDAELLWARVRGFAEACLRANRPVPTLNKQIRNFITDVTATSIGRRSDDGRSNASRVTKGEVARLWIDLQGGSRAGVLYFTKALVAAAVPDVVEVENGDIRLRAGERHAFLLTWNPARWPWSTLDEDLDRLLHGDSAEHRWSTGNTKKIHAGDRLFLLKQGAPPRGILASGFATGKVFEDRHFLDDRAAAGDTALYVQLRFDRLVSPESVLAVDRLRDGALGRVNWATQASGLELTAEAASQLETAWAAYDPARTPGSGPDELIPGLNYVEGIAKTTTVNRYERDPRARRACIAKWGTNCAVCEFSFVDFYGDIGDGYIHVHHLTPLAAGRGRRAVDPIKDLRPVCPNCHAMLHAAEPPLSIEELREHCGQAARKVSAASRGG